jgi:RNA polymerase sigma factor (sigma-70 family)
MLNRWFAASRSQTSGNGGEGEDSPVKEADFIVLPPAASDSWRTWLMTGVRRGPFHRRRVQGPHQDLKKMLIEGTSGPVDGPQPWNDFSSAMVRQSVDEALNALPSDQKQAVKLAYFGGLTNREIAEHLGVGEGGVRRRLRDALAAVSARVEQSRLAGRRAVYAIAGWLAARAVFDGAQRSAAPVAEHGVQAAAVVTVAIVAAAVMVASPVSPLQHNEATGGAIQSVQPAPARTSPVDAKQVVPAVPAAGSLPAASPAVPTVEPPAVKIPGLPVLLPVPVNLPVAVPTPTILPTLP